MSCSIKVNKLITKWRPFQELSSKTCDKTNNNFAVLILNTPIGFNNKQDFILNIWNKASVRITVDGGTSQWMKWIEKQKIQFCSVPPPDLITGDMDSLSETVLNYFSTEYPDIRIVRTPDQDRTDFHKALCELQSHCTSKNIQIESIYVIVDTCGRLDQILANINALFKSSDIVGETKIFLVAETSFTWLLSKGFHSIEVPEELRDAQKWCSLLPVGGPCKVTTTGLKWNLTNGTLEFGGMVSSSNTYDGSECVTIETDSPLVWSMSISNFL